MQILGKVVKMAKGKYIWLIGNDDLLYENAFKELEKLFIKHQADFIYKLIKFEFKICF